MLGRACDLWNTINSLHCFFQSQFRDVLEMGRLRTFLASVLVASTAVLPGSMALLFPFGSSSGDTGMEDPVKYSPPISLTLPFVLFQDSYTTVYVS